MTHSDNKNATANLNETATMKYARVTEQASMKYSPLVNEIGHWISILHQTQLMYLCIQTQTINSTDSTNN